MNEKYRWIFEHLEDFKQSIIVLEFCKKHRIQLSCEAYMEADEESKALALSFLLLLMGETIPSQAYTIDDYSELYTVLNNNRDNLNLRDYY